MIKSSTPQIAFITGATSGIGKACAELFASKQFNLILVGRRVERLDEIAIGLKKSFHIDIVALNIDVSNKNMVEQSLHNLPEQWKAVDVLINNAGLSLGLEPIHEGNTDDWDIMIDTNVKGLLYVSRIITQWMITRKKGHIINIGSIAGKETYPNGNVYCATKHAVDSLSKAMRIDLLPHQIKVTAIHPGAVETEFSEVRFKGDINRAKKVYEGFEPLYAQDIAETVWFVASRPAHVNINDMVVMPAAQANATIIKRN